MYFANTNVLSLWDFKGMAEAVKNGAKKEDFSPLQDEHDSLKNIMGHQIGECRGWSPTDTTGGAYGCSNKEDVIVLIENNIIDRCTARNTNMAVHPLDIAREQYAKSMVLGENFDFESWEKVCDFTRSDIMETSKKIKEDL